MKNRSTTVKRLVSSVFTIVIMLMIPVISVNADSMKYQADSAEFTAVLDEYGDALITEEWNITYTEGSFTRFYKEIKSQSTGIYKKYSGKVMPDKRKRRCGTVQYRP